MYKLKKEYIGQNVIVYTQNKRVIKLESATQDELKMAYEIKGNEKFITKGNIKEEVKEEQIEDKPVVKRGRPRVQ